MGVLAKAGIKRQGKVERSRAERLCVSAGNGWSLGRARQAWLSRHVGEAWG